MACGLGPLGRAAEKGGLAVHIGAQKGRVDAAEKTPGKGESQVPLAAYFLKGLPRQS